MDETYLIIADPMEQPPDVDEQYDAVVCTGDLLELAPPPGSDPDGSVIDALYDAEAAYADGPEAVMDLARDARDSERSQRLAEQRYHDLLDAIELPVLAIAGNQDYIDVLETVAEDRADIQILDDHRRFQGFQGFVPAFSDLPEDVFPSERTAEEFYDTIGDAEADTLIAHGLPDGFEPSDYGFDQAFCSAESSDHESEDIHALESIRDGDHALFSP